jgi:hypothetical protein
VVGTMTGIAASMSTLATARRSRDSSADDRLNVTGLFDAAVSAAQDPVSRKQRPTVVETRSNEADPF